MASPVGPLMFRDSRIFSQQGQLCYMQLQATIGSSGAITIAAAPKNMGIVSITKQSTAGQYTIILSQAYKRLLAIIPNVTNAAGIAAAPDMGILAASDITTRATGITIQFSSGGSATNLASGDVLNLVILVNNSDQQG